MKKILFILVSFIAIYISISHIIDKNQKSTFHIYGPELWPEINQDLLIQFWEDL